MSITERELENRLYLTPGLVNTCIGRVTGWLARQYVVPTGRIDLLGFIEHKHGRSLAVVEVKKGRINSSALTQVCRYASDIDRIVIEITGTVGPLTTHDAKVYKIVVGSHINEREHMAADGMDVQPCTYSLKDGELRTHIPYLFTPERFQMCDRLAADSPFEMWVKQAREEARLLGWEADE